MTTDADVMAITVARLQQLLQRAEDRFAWASEGTDEARALLNEIEGKRDAARTDAVQLRRAIALLEQTAAVPLRPAARVEVTKDTSSGFLSVAEGDVVGAFPVTGASDG